MGAPLAQMTREEKLKLLEALEERERRETLKREAYKPNVGQRAVHQCDKKTRLVISGNGAGKTALAVHEAVWAAQGYNPISKEYLSVPRRVAVILDKNSKVADKWIPEIRKWFGMEEFTLHKNGHPYVDEIRLKNGSEIRFFFHEQEPLTFESIEVDDTVFDEPPPRHVFVAILRGMRNKDKAGKVLVIGTPLTGAWLRREIYEPWSRNELSDTECFRFSTSVNEANLPDGYVQWFSSKLTEKERAIRIDGQFFDLDGLALAHLFKKESHILPVSVLDNWDQELPTVIAIDPHPGKPSVAILMGADKYGPVYLKEMSAKLTPRKFAKKLKEFYKGFRVIDIVCDDLGSGETTGGEDFKSFIEVLQSEGIQVRPTRWEDKHDEEWVTRLQDALDLPEEPDILGRHIPALRFVEGNKGIVTDIETVEWAKHRNIEELKPTLAIGAKDYLACLKYALATNIHVNKRKEKAYYRNKPAYGINPRHVTQENRKAKIIMRNGRSRYGLSRGKL